MSDLQINSGLKTIKAKTAVEAAPPLMRLMNSREWWKVMEDEMAKEQSL